jgi:hypothetical protein
VQNIEDEVVNTSAKESQGDTNIDMREDVFCCRPLASHSNASLYFIFNLNFFYDEGGFERYLYFYFTALYVFLKLVIPYRMF